MVILREPFVIPTSLAWLGLLAVIGILAFCAQILLTMGFQRETAGRASMGLYTQVRVSSVQFIALSICVDHLHIGSRAYLFPRHTDIPFSPWNIHNHVLCYLRCGE
jgi:hypothetical protein